MRRDWEETRVAAGGQIRYQRKEGKAEDNYGEGWSRNLFCIRAFPPKFH